MSDTFDKIINLINRTGDRCVVYNPQNESSYVIMGLSEYEKLLSSGQEMRELTEDELLNKINRDIALWKAAHSPARHNVFEDKLNQSLKKEEPKVIQKNPSNVFSTQSTIEPQKKKEVVPDEGEDEKYFFEPPVENE